MTIAGRIKHHTIQVLLGDSFGRLQPGVLGADLDQVLDSISALHKFEPIWVNVHDRDFGSGQSYELQGRDT
ncbi:MAG: hypothetical protein MUF23_06100, partial [Pirellula sp.]|nr:hypothetical protein [Pirellula sp.]